MEKILKIFQRNQPLYMQRLNVNSGVVLFMSVLSDLLKKAPQSIKDKYKIKIRKDRNYIR